MMTSLAQNNCSKNCVIPLENNTKEKVSFFTLLLQWNETYKSRQQLGALEPAILKDIGISAETAKREAALPFWRTTRFD